MKNKKFYSIILCIMIIVSLTTCLFTACDDDEEDLGTSLESKKGDVVTGLSAYTLVNAAYYNWKDNITTSNYRREEYLDFKAEALNATLATQKVRQIYKVCDESIYTEKITISTGAAGNSEGYRYYCTGSNYYKSSVDKKKVSKDEFSISGDWPNYSTTTDSDKKVKMLTSYDLSSKSYLKSGSDDKVYKYKDDESLYVCVINIDCSEAAFKGVQSKASDEFYDATGCKSGTLKMETVRIAFLLEKVGTTYRIVQYESFEKYSGQQTLGITAKCQQTYKAKFKYDATSYTITNSELMNLA